MRLVGGRIFGCTLMLTVMIMLTACAGERSMVVAQHDMTSLERCLGCVDRGNYQGAVHVCKIAVADDPTAEAFAGLGIAYMRVGKRNLALTALKKAVALNPRDTFALYKLCALYSLMNRKELALEVLDAALVHGFNNMNALRFDDDLDNIRGEAGFGAVLARHYIVLE